MERIGVRELRQHASRYLDRVKTGESIEVAERGHLVALLVPPDAATSARARLIATGRLLPASRPFRIPIRETANPGTPHSGAVLDELREDWS